MLSAAAGCCLQLYSVACCCCCYISRMNPSINSRKPYEYEEYGTKQARVVASAKRYFLRFSTDTFTQKSSRDSSSASSEARTRPQLAQNKKKLNSGQRSAYEQINVVYVTACKDEFRRNLRSYSWSVFLFSIILFIIYI